MDDELRSICLRRLQRLETGNGKQVESVIDESYQSNNHDDEEGNDDLEERSDDCGDDRGEQRASVWIYRQFYGPEDADYLMSLCQEELPWEQHRHRMGMEARLTTLLGDKGVVHSYSGSKRPTQPWGETNAGAELGELKDLINKVFGAEVNSCLLNRYRDKNDYISYHSDTEIRAPNNYVFALSLGQERPFYFKRKKTTEFGKMGEVIETTIRSGDLMLMEGATQEYFTHSVPKRTAKSLDWGERISVTFREL